jgi:hypothetical protein
MHYVLGNSFRNLIYKASLKRKTKMPSLGTVHAKLLCAFALVFLLNLPSSGQTASGSISGTISDPSGGRVSGATLILTNTSTTQVRSTTTNDLGYYSFQLLSPAVYRLQVNMPGFQRFIANNIALNVGQAVAQDVNLQIGQASQTVTVDGSGPQLESESSSLGQVLSK